jgi:hypothetical protein
MLDFHLLSEDTFHTSSQCFRSIQHHQIPLLQIQSAVHQIFQQPFDHRGVLRGSLPHSQHERKRQQLLFIVVSRIAPAKSDLAKHMLRASKRTFCVDHPILSEHWSEPGREDFRLSEELQASVEVEPAILKSAFESFVELAAKDGAEHSDGKKEIVAWFDPAGVISR